MTNEKKQAVYKRIAATSKTISMFALSEGLEETETETEALQFAGAAILNAAVNLAVLHGVPKQQFMDALSRGWDRTVGPTIVITTTGGNA